MNAEVIMLSQEKDIPYDLNYIWNPKKKKIKTKLRESPGWVAQLVTQGTYPVGAHTCSKW